VLGDGTSSLAAVLAGNDYKEEWRFLRALDQRNPWDTHPHAVGPGDLEEVSFQGQAGRGITWAKKNGSAVFSFGFPPLWDQDPLHATYAELTDTGEVMAVATDVANLSRLEHVQRNAELLHNYGGEVSPSSLVYEGNGFAVRMYFDDHDPPHFHVLLRRDTSDTQAKCRVDNFDLLAGELPAVLRRRVKEWARNRTVDLMRNWARCREGRHPYVGRLGQLVQ
jgi:hypothetical protein